MPPDIPAALVTDPALMALVCFAGLAVGAALAVWAIDQGRRLTSRKDEP